jgi:hypothetical protein
MIAPNANYICIVPRFKYIYVTILPTYTRKVLSSSKYNFNIFLHIPIRYTEFVIKIATRTTVNIIKVRYMYFLYYKGVNFSRRDRKIVIISHNTTKINNITGWCIRLFLFVFSDIC